MRSDLTVSATEVTDWKTGEIISLPDAATDRLAELSTNLDDVQQALNDARAVVSDELVARLDRDAQWTARVGDPTDRQWEIKAPSPTAGATIYPPDVLEQELRALVDRGVVTPAAAGKALRRQITLTLDIPLELPLKDTAAALANITIRTADTELPIVKADHSMSVVAAGVNALRKVPGTNAALDRAKHVEPPGRRRAKVTLKAKDG